MNAEPYLPRLLPFSGPLVVALPSLFVYLQLQSMAETAPHMCLEISPLRLAGLPVGHSVSVFFRQLTPPLLLEWSSRECLHDSFPKSDNNLPS